MDIRALIDKVNKSNGSELHLKIGAKPLMRKNKFLKHMDFPSLTAEDMQHLFSELLTKTETEKFEKTGSFEANYFGAKPCNFRLYLFYSQQQPVALIKIINKKIPSLDAIGLGHFKPMLDAKKGLFIVSGPARSGITTTLASLVEEINTSFPRHVLIIEDTIEYEFQPKLSKISQRQFKKDVNVIEQAINFAKRMDVDVLVIGDLKRSVPFKNVLNYVSGGHFVILSMQTLGVENTIEKFVYSFPETDRVYVCETLAENLLGICSQSLLAGSLGKTVPVREILMMNPIISGILAKCRFAHIMPNINTAGPGSISFADSIKSLAASGVLNKETGTEFLNYLTGIRG